MNDTKDILIIDDSEDDQQLYRRSLKNSTLSCEIREALTGEDGLLCLLEKTPDCILLDYSMPGYNGVEVLKRIRRDHPFVPIVMLTGQGNESVAVTAMQEGAQNYIVKSMINPESLEHIIRIAMDHCALQKRIHEQRTSLEVFTRALAHDLKEPVRTIRSFTGMIAESEEFSGKSAEYFEHIQQAAQRMHMLIDTVFSYTQLDNPVKPPQERCDTSKILEETKANLQQLIDERGAVITYYGLPQLLFNRPQLTQLFQNLLSNAIQHSPSAVTIQVNAEEAEHHWMFRVTDNGPGIEKTYLEKIFLPFKRLAPTTQEGAGLGLSICKKIVESYQGNMWCESRPGKGTSFYFTLPKSQPYKPSLVPESHSEHPLPSAPSLKSLANILLVDDSRADIEMTQYRLIARPQLECNLFVAHNGKEALAQLRDMAARQESIDLILLDINMPGMDGFEMLEIVRSDAALQDIPVVMCSGSTYEKDMERAKALGAVGYIVKPAEFDTLKSLLDSTDGLEIQQENQGYSLLRIA